ncbi:MAG: hypothetical protein DRJ55_06640 [Thermoprotei archaeon]|nr:MAG: hypothetical protein DRJ55_06640 [Thermoprotei archaeon]
MKLLYDASALLNLIRRLGEDSLESLRGNYILTLTPYEVANALWKEAVLLHRITVEEARSLLSFVSAAYKLLKPVKPANMLLVLRVACDLKITCYDSAYIVASHEQEARLVTDDDKLRKRIQKRKEQIVKILGKEPVLMHSTDIGK